MYDFAASFSTRSEPNAFGETEHFAARLLEIGMGLLPQTLGDCACQEGRTILRDEQIGKPAVRRQFSCLLSDGMIHVVTRMPCHVYL